MLPACCACVTSQGSLQSQQRNDTRFSFSEAGHFTYITCYITYITYLGSFLNSWGWMEAILGERWPRLSAHTGFAGAGGGLCVCTQWIPVLLWCLGRHWEIGGFTHMLPQSDLEAFKFPHWEASSVSTWLGSRWDPPCFCLPVLTEHDKNLAEKEAVGCSWTLWRPNHSGTQQCMPSTKPKWSEKFKSGMLMYPFKLNLDLDEKSL